MSTTPRRPGTSSAKPKSSQQKVQTASSKKVAATSKPAPVSTAPSPARTAKGPARAGEANARQPGTQAKATQPVSLKADKVKKPKLVRDSFTIPKNEYAALDELKLRAAKLGHPVKKSELLRAGIKALTAQADATLLRALAAVPSIKTGRPKKD